MLPLFAKSAGLPLPRYCKSHTGGARNTLVLGTPKVQVQTTGTSDMSRARGVHEELVIDGVASPVWLVQEAATTQAAN